MTTYWTYGELAGAPGAQMTALRRIAGLTRFEAAKLAGLTDRELRDYESGLREFPVSVSSLLYTIYGKTLAHGGWIRCADEWRDGTLTAKAVR